VKKILVVDDQALLRELVRVTLMSDRCEVIEAQSGEEAIEIAQAQKPDLILMDIMMPGGMDGFEASRILKSTDETASCPIIAMTAKVQQADREKAKQSGVDDYLTKPFSLADLRSRVEAHIG